MAILDELVTQIDNPDLRARIAAEVEKLAKQKKFGLVFEEHLPECTPLYEIPVKVGATVALKEGQVNDVYAVLKIENGVATCLGTMGLIKRHILTMLPQLSSKSLCR